MNVSVGIMVYNGEKNIGNILRSILKQNTKTVKIREIIVVSSGSTDKTNIIVKHYCKKNKKIKLITQEKREGKASAINEFLQKAKSDILVLESADTIPSENAIEKLCKPLNNNKIGVVASRPIPKGKARDYLSFVVKLQWLLHHKISLIQPKFGELIAFRKLIRRINNTASDEEYIAMCIKNKNFNGVYVSDAYVYNIGPKTITDFLKQRRRGYWGYFELKKKYDYRVKTMDNLCVLRILLKEISPKNIFPIIFAILIESYARLLGLYDYYTNKKHYIWEIVESSKT